VRGNFPDLPLRLKLQIFYHSARVVISVEFLPITTVSLACPPFTTARTECGSVHFLTLDTYIDSESAPTNILLRIMEVENLQSCARKLFTNTPPVFDFRRSFSAACSSRSTNGASINSLKADSVSGSSVCRRAVASCKMLSGCKPISASILSILFLNALLLVQAKSVVLFIR